jgi:hypothetical protein
MNLGLDYHAYLLLLVPPFFGWTHRVQATLNQLKAPLRKSEISYEQFLPMTAEIIKKQYQNYRSHRSTLPSNPSSPSIKLPVLHLSYEVMGLLLIPLPGLLKPSLLYDHHSHRGVFRENLAVQVFPHPGSHFGVRVEWCLHILLISHRITRQNKVLKKLFRLLFSFSGIAIPLAFVLARSSTQL